MNSSRTGPGEERRTIVTEQALRVTPELLGVPLAAPRRRAAALLVDGMIVAVLANAPAVFFGAALAFVLLKASARPVAGGLVRRSVRWTQRFAAALVVFATVVSLGGLLEAMGNGDRAEERAQTGEVVLSGLQGVAAGRDLLGLARSMEVEDEARARERLTEVVSRLQRAGMRDQELVGLLTELSEGGGAAWMSAMADSAIATLRESAPAPIVEARPDGELLDSYLAAREAGDAAAVASARARLGLAFARDTVTALNAAVDEARQRREMVEDRMRALEAANDVDRGVVAGFLRLLEDLGLQIGWTGLYFCSLLVLWKGRTPGKRLLGMRVVRLDGKPIGWYVALERFGGYAAGLATGLLGFLQIYWDDNRQTIQDRIAGTVVVRE